MDQTATLDLFGYSAECRLRDKASASARSYGSC
jgi:hypothetical protein